MLADAKRLSPLRSLRLPDYFVIGAFAVVCGYVYRGFYFPDPYILAYGSFAGRILLPIQILFPVLCLGIIVLYGYIRRNNVGWGPVVLALVSISFALSLCYAIGTVFYERWFESHLQEYHPYLQLAPKNPDSFKQRTTDAVLVFCLGGSTTEIPDSKGGDWPSRVQKILRDEYGLKNVRVDNLGRQWYTSLHTLINYEANLRQYKPAIILIMQSVNDLLQNADFSYLSHGKFREDYGHFDGPLYRVIRRRTLWRYVSDVLTGLWYAKPRQVLTTSDFPGLASYTRNIETISQLARLDGTTVILMTEPTLMKPAMSPQELDVVGMLKVEAINDTLMWSPQTLLNGMEQYNGALKAIARQQKLPLIDLEREIPKSLTFFRDEVHYRDTTFAIIAPIVAKQIHDVLSSRHKK